MSLRLHLVQLRRRFLRLRKEVPCAISFLHTERQEHNMRLVLYGAAGLVAVAVNVLTYSTVLLA